MSSLNIHLKNLNKQHGGSGIPFSEFMKQKKKSKRKTNVRKKSTRSQSRKKKVTRRTKKRKVSRKSNKKKRCKCGTHTYTGKENTPRGLGKCEECIPLNVIMKGKDGFLYENKNYHWIKFNEL